MKILHNSFVRFILIGSITFLISSCGGTYKHAYKGESEFYADINSCQAEANQVFPPLMSVPSSYGNNTSETTCSPSGNDYVCTTSDTPRYVVNNSYDTDKSNKQKYGGKCLAAKGCRYVNN